MIKKGDSSLNVVFKNGTYTNKLFARNVNLTHNPSGALLALDFSHYFNRKRNSPEDTDFEVLLKLHSTIAHFLIADETVQKAIADARVVQVDLKLSDKLSVTVPVSAYDKASGMLK